MHYTCFNMHYTCFNMHYTASLDVCRILWICMTYVTVFGKNNWFAFFFCFVTFKSSEDATIQLEANTTLRLRVKHFFFLYFH